MFLKSWFYLYSLITFLCLKCQCENTPVLMCKGLGRAVGPKGPVNKCLIVLLSVFSWKVLSSVGLKAAFARRSLTSSLV